MIHASDTDPSAAFAVLSSLGLSTSFLVPTETAMKKSIIDATYPVRKHFRDNGFHDYALQHQGEATKEIKKSFFVGPDKLTETKTSLYRPTTKDGDPRIWFYNLKSYAEAYNLLALLVVNSDLYIINCSDRGLIASLEDGSNPLFAATGIASSGLSPSAAELLSKLRVIGQKGWVPSLRSGDTGVGFTLETLLGIPANASRTPDFKGVEIKSGRAKSSNQTLFAKTPDWKGSPSKSALELLNRRGRYSEEKQRLQLFHSIFAPRPNSYDLQLEVDHEKGLLKQFCVILDKHEDDVFWELEVLQEALRKKHAETFWVRSKNRDGKDGEEFLFYEGTYTRGPNINAFPLLLEAGDIFVDYTMWAPSPGKQNNKGFLFRMRKNRLEMLFGKPRVFELNT